VDIAVTNLYRSKKAIPKYLMRYLISQQNGTIYFDVVPKKKIKFSAASGTAFLFNSTRGNKFTKLVNNL
jgi:hypothetical protein